MRFPDREIPIHNLQTYYGNPGKSCHFWCPHYTGFMYTMRAYEYNYPATCAPTQITHPPIPVDQRICSLCKSNTTSTVEDEKHFLLHCPIYQSARKSLFDFIKTIHRHFLYLSSDDKFHWIMTTENPQILIKLAKYVSKCLSLRRRFVLAY